jgi:hypothetical protein
VTSPPILPESANNTQLTPVRGDVDHGQGAESTASPDATIDSNQPFPSRPLMPHSYFEQPGRWQFANARTRVTRLTHTALMDSGNASSTLVATLGTEPPSELYPSRVSSSTKPTNAQPTACAAVHESVVDITAPGGILDESILRRASAVVQVVNCVGIVGDTASTALTGLLPYGCPYKGRGRKGTSLLCTTESRVQAGSVNILAPPTGANQQTSVVNLNATFRPGRPSVSAGDSAQQRLFWFGQCLETLGSTLPTDWSCIAFPYGLGEDSWSLYRSAIESFANNHPSIEVLIVRNHASLVTGAHAVLSEAARTGASALTFASQSS